MSYRTRLVANLPALLRGQQSPLPLGRSRGKAGLAPRLFRPHIPYCPSRCIFFRSPQSLAEAGEQRSSPEEVAPPPDGISAGRLAYSPGRFGRLTQAFEDDGHIKLNFEHDYVEHPASLSTFWFRDACPCNECVSESSGQKRFAACDIDAKPQLESCRVKDNGDLEVIWANDLLNGNSHTSLYPLNFLQQVVLMRGGLHRHWRFTPARILWDERRFADDMEARFISYEDWMAGGDAFAKAFLDLFRWGLVFIRGVPESHGAVQDVASKIGDLQSTFYGLTWDVISKPNAENVAYTNEFLCLHQDLLYWKDTPKIQLLHCLKNECEGGESLFSDGLRTARDLQLKNEATYNTLAKEGVNFHYVKNGNFYFDRRKVISESAHGCPIRVNWSPPFQAPFYHKPDASSFGVSRRLERWRKAARAFRDNLELPTNMLQYRLRPGDCVVFDNQRILHGRTKFDTSAGNRHLRGGYIDQQTLTSAFVRLGEQGALGALDNQLIDNIGGGREKRGYLPGRGRPKQ